MILLFEILAVISICFATEVTGVELRFQTNR